MARIFTYGFENRYSKSTTYSMDGTFDGIPFVNYVNHYNLWESGRVEGYCMTFKTSYANYYGYMNLTETVIGANDEIYIRLWLRSNKATTNCDFLTVFSDSNNLCKLKITPTAETDIFLIELDDTSGNSIYTSYGLAVGTWYKVDLKVKIGELGQITLKLNDRTLYDVTHSLGTTKINNIKIGGVKYYAGNGSVSIDDIAINNNLGATHNSWCGNGYVKKLIPIANGSKVEFTPSANTNYNNLIEDISDGVTTNNSTDIVGATDLFSLTKLAPTLGDNTKLNYCRLYVNACYTENGVSLIPVIKDGDQERTLETLQLSLKYAFKYYDILNNPNTSLPYTCGELDKLEFGYRNGG